MLFIWTFFAGLRITKFNLIQIDGFSCQCAPGFHGFLCQHMTNHCATSPCRNNATCINQGAQYLCECPLGFEGLLEKYLNFDK